MFVMILADTEAHESTMVSVLTEAADISQKSGDARTANYAQQLSSRFHALLKSVEENTDLPDTACY